MRQSKYSEAYREQFLREALRPGGVGVYRLARERGLSNGMVYRWLSDARESVPMTDKPRRPEDLSAQEKLRVLAEASSLSDSKLGEFIRREGIHESDLARWREEALRGLSGAGKAAAPSKRERDLERELRRKDKALAEAVALVVLAKKARALWADADDDTSES